MVSNIIEVPSIAVDLDSTTSSVAIGDPISGLKATVDTNGGTGNNELHVKDDDLLTEISNLGTIDFATEATQGLVKDELISANASLASMDAKLPSGLTVVANELKVAANVKSALIGVPYDQVVLTYVGATTDIATVVAKQSGVTVATLTLTYDGSNRLVDVTRT